MWTDSKRGRRYSLQPFSINSNELPDISTNNILKRKSFDKGKVNVLLKRNPKNYETIQTESKKIIEIRKDEDQKNTLTPEKQKYLDKKIIHLINCYKELKFSENSKKIKLKKYSLTNSLPKKLNNNNNNIIANNSNIILSSNNILSKSLTKTYKISELEDKEGIKKLDEWDKNNLAQIYGNTDIIYNLLLRYYKKKGEYKKILELDYYKTIIESNGDDVGKIINVQNSTNNKIVKDFINLRVKEQKYILKNNIVKTQSRFDKNSLYSKEKKLAVNLGIDNETLAEIRKNEENGNNNYDKVIKDKDKKEISKKEELVSILIKIFNKKLEKNNKEKEQSDNFEKINQIYIKYNAKIMKIQDAVDTKRELYERINEAEYPKENLIEKINRLKEIKSETDIQIKKQDELKKELNEEMKKLNKIKDEINEELEICKNEISYMKLVYINLVKNQRNYYLDLLKKGYDVRGEGLVWVVKRLLEIQAKLEYHHFPKFLDHNQIKYIIEIANLSLEETQLKTILKIVEKKRNDIQSSVNNKVMNKIVELSKLKNRHRASIFTLEMEKIRSQLIGQDSSTKIFETFQKIYKKYKSSFIRKNIQKDEDLRIKSIIEELRTSLIEGGGKTTNKNFKQLTGILDYLNSNKESKEYLEVILLIRFRLSYINKLRESLKEEQLNSFREMVNNTYKNRFFNAELSLRLDLVKAALFGDKV